MKKLKDPIEPLSRLMERASGLQEKLGPILFQFPHTWHINIERLQPFLELLQTYPQQRFTLLFSSSKLANSRSLQTTGTCRCSFLFAC